MEPVPKLEKGVPPKLKDHLKKTADAITTRTPVAGHYITVEDRAGQGQLISVDGAALAASGIPGLGGSITVTTEDASGYSPGSGVGSVSNVTVITFDQDNFEIYDGGGGQVVVKLKTCPATCP